MPGLMLPPKTAATTFAQRMTQAERQLAHPSSTEIVNTVSSSSVDERQATPPVDDTPSVPSHPMVTVPSNDDVVAKKAKSGYLCRYECMDKHGERLVSASKYALRKHMANIHNLMAPHLIVKSCHSCEKHFDSIEAYDHHWYVIDRRVNIKSCQPEDMWQKPYPTTRQERADTWAHADDGSVSLKSLVGRLHEKALKAMSSGIVDLTDAVASRPVKRKRADSCLGDVDDQSAKRPKQRRTDQHGTVAAGPFAPVNPYPLLQGTRPVLQGIGLHDHTPGPWLRAAAAPSMLVDAGNDRNNVIDLTEDGDDQMARLMMPLHAAVQRIRASELVRVGFQRQHRR